MKVVIRGKTERKGKKDLIEKDIESLKNKEIAYLNLTFTDFIMKYYLSSEYFINHLKDIKNKNDERYSKFYRHYSFNYVNYYENSRGNQRKSEIKKK